MSCKDIKTLRNSGRLIFEVVSGSHSYGLQSAESDTDLRGVFVIPAKERISLSEAVEEIADEKQNEKYYDALCQVADFRGKHTGACLSACTL